MNSFLYPSQSGPCKIVEFDREKCTGCNACTNVCPSDVIMPNPEKGREPIVVFGEECWFCGGCVEECPNQALTLVTPAKQRLSTVWMRKDTGKEYRVGMKNPLPPNTTPPSGNR